MFPKERGLGYTNVMDHR